MRDIDEGDLLICSRDDVQELLEGREADVLAAVRRAYVAHARGLTEVPHSSFLRFPDAPRERIIALPAYLGGDAPVAGIKWVASFPGNLRLGLERASATMILNSLDTGRPRAFLEASLINARRTAAGAAIAAQALGGRRAYRGLGLIGCGVINGEIIRFALATQPGLDRLLVYDVDPDRAALLAARWRRPGLVVEVAGGPEEVLAGATLVSIATTAAEPHIDDLGMCQPGTTILHVSLRDLTAAAIAGCVNVVDDPDHVCREGTSLHLAEQLLGHRAFIHGTLGDVLCGRLPGRPAGDAPVVFSPFGLGILDLAVAALVCDLVQAGDGTVVRGFMPGPAPVGRWVTA